VVLGFLLSYWQAHYSQKKAAREQLLAQMQQLVLAAADLDRARKEFDAVHVGRRVRLRTAGLALVEFWGAWNVQGRTWVAAAGAMSPAARLVQEWDRGTLLGAREVTLAMSRVAAAGLPLGMSEDPAVAQAAQRIMDASFADEDEAAVREAIRELRAAIYPGQTPPPPPLAP
jgi:hypothetical protein